MSVNPLPNGTIITSGKTSCVLGNCISRGGSCFVYEVDSIDGNSRRCLIKEACPNGPYLLAREGAEICAKDARSKAALDACRESVRREQEIGAAIDALTRRTAGIWEIIRADQIVIGQNAFPAGEAVFALLPELSGHGAFVRDLDRDSLSLHAISGILLSIAKTVSILHENKFLFGDISPSNIYLEENPGKKGSYDMAVLIDFGASQKLDSNGKTHPLERFSFSSGFAGPEVFSGAGEPVVLSPAYDVFSIGCLFLYLLKRLPPENAMNNQRSALFWHVRPENLIQREGRPAAVRKALEIMKKSLNADPEQRYASATDMLPDLEKLAAAAAPPRYVLNPNLTTSAHWVKDSRQAELKQLQDQLDCGDHPLWIHGMGGIGKSELAIRFALQQRNRTGDQAKEAFFVVYLGTMRDTIRALIPEYELIPIKGETAEQRSEREIRERLRVLKDNYEGALFVVDNFDSETRTLSELLSEDICKEFLALPIHVLFTTRFRPNTEVRELESLAEKDLLKLFRSCAPDVDAADEEILELIRAVDGHSLTVELLASSAQESWDKLTAADLLDAIHKSALDSEAFPDVVSDKDRAYREARILRHLEAVFNLSGLDESEKSVLCHASLLPADGMNAKRFLAAEGAEEKAGVRRLEKLEKRHWLKRKGELLTIHPIVREVVKSVLRPSYADCEAFVDKLFEAQERSSYRDDNSQYLQLYEHVIDLGDISEGNLAINFNRVRQLNYYIAQFQASLEYKIKAMKSLEMILPPDHPDLATAYSNVGREYKNDKNLKSYETALEYETRAMRIWEQNLPPDHPKLAYKYESVGRTYSKFGDYEAALEYAIKAVKILEKDLLADDDTLAESYELVGMAYRDWGDHKSALMYFIKDMRIWELKIRAQKFWLQKIHKDNILYLANSYSNVGAEYAALGYHDKARKHLTRAIRIWEQRPQTYLSYKSLWRAYMDLGDHKTALMHVTKNTEFLGKQPMCYYYIGAAYAALGDHEAALEYFTRAVKAWEKELPPNHPEFAFSYNYVGVEYGKLGDHDKALEYLTRAMKIRGKKLPPNHPDLATSYNNVGAEYAALGDHKTALEYLTKSMEIREKKLSPDHPDLATSYHNVGDEYRALGDHDKARKYKAKAMRIREKKISRRISLIWRLAITMFESNTRYWKATKRRVYEALGEYDKKPDYKAIVEKILDA